MSRRSNLRGGHAIAPMRSPLPVVTTARAEAEGVVHAAVDSKEVFVRTPAHYTSKTFKAVTGCSWRPRRDNSTRRTHAQSDSCSSGVSDESDQGIASSPFTPECPVPATPGAPHRPSAMCMPQTPQSPSPQTFGGHQLQLLVPPSPPLVPAPGSATRTFKHEPYFFTAPGEVNGGRRSSLLDKLKK